jgi:uncharacterized protein DUF4340
MSQKIQILSAVLVLQLFLIVILTLTEKNTGAFAANEKLLSLKLDEIDKITISAKDNQSAVLHKQKETWTLPDYFNFPADKQKLQQIIDELVAIDRPWPVATTGAAKERFKVANDNFERKIVFSKADDVQQTLYLGSSPGFRKVHARINEEDDIYDIEFAVYKVSAEAKDWTKKDYLHIAKSDITNIKIGDVSLKREGDVLQVADLNDSEISNTEEINKLVDKLASLNFSEVLGTADKPEFQQKMPVLEYEIIVQNEKPVQYILSKLKDKDDYVLQQSSAKYYFKIPKSVGDDIVGISRARLITKKPGEPAESAAEATEETAVDQPAVTESLPSTTK